VRHSRPAGLARPLLCFNLSPFAQLTLGLCVAGATYVQENGLPRTPTSLNIPIEGTKDMSEDAILSAPPRNQPAAAAPRARAIVPVGVALVSAIAMASCSPVPTLPPAPMEPGPTVSSANLPPYHIQVGDVLEVRLLLNPELNEEITVRPDGHISTTAVPDMLALGRTPADLADSLRGVYAHDLQKPRLSVVVKSFAPTRIYVGGEVNTPGEFVTVGPTLTLSQAIARAGGTKLSSDDTSVFIIRRGPTDKPELLSTSWKALRQARNPDADVRLAPYDVVYVPKLGIAEVYQFYNQYIGQFANPSFGFSYQLNPTNSGVVTQSVPAATTR
jgi:polysaccharide biosynthesis/export protein